LAIATLIAFLAVFSIWVNRQALNTDNWVNTSDKLLQNEEVKTQLSNYLADELFANVDVQAELEKTSRRGSRRSPVRLPGRCTSSLPRSPKGRWKPRRRKISGAPPIAAPTKRC
jgi:hypothetical protein